MRKQHPHLKFCIVLIFFLVTGRFNAQCLFASQYGSGVVNSTNPGYSITITTCQFGGEFAPLTFNVTGAFSFSSSVGTDYFTLVNSTNSVIAFGTTPLNVVIPTTGTYYLHTAASGPPACGVQNTCRTTRVFVPFPPCAGVPQTGTTTANPSVICPNTSATLSLPGSSNGSGLAYQWYASTTGSMGLYSPIAGAGSATFATLPSVSVTTWYQAIISCTNGNLSATSPPVSVNIAGTTTNSIPYSEGFEGLIVNNQLPNCSWKASNMPQTCQTYVAQDLNNRVPRTGSKFASFYYSPATTSYFYTNGLDLKAGVTYSASVWYTTEYYTYTNWTNLSLLIGPNQSTLGLQAVASSSGTAASPNYKALSNTFTVGTSGIYYLAIRANSSGACCAQYLSFDDIEVSAPCSVNTPSAALVVSNDSICAGQSINFTMFGNNNHYLWNTGATSSSLTVMPMNSVAYSVVCTNTLSACSTTLNQYIEVFPSPLINILPSSYSVCPGESVMLTAFGASTYTWNNGSNGVVNTVNPLVNTTYSLVGTNSYGCSSQANAGIMVYQLPNITATSPKNVICAGEAISFTASGASAYTWQNGNNLYVGSTINVVLNSTSIFTVTGTDTKGCKNSTLLIQNVNECTGVSENFSPGNSTLVYPNPGNGNYRFDFTSDGRKTVEVFDLMGKSLAQFATQESSISLDLSSLLANGVYLVKIQTEIANEMLQLIKQ